MTDVPDHINESGPVSPSQHRTHDSNYTLNELKRIEVDNTDAFGARVTKNWRNDIDIASHYPFNPERLRLFKNDTRQFVQYNSIAEFEDANDIWKLKPAGGDTMHIESAESSSYVVNYNTQTSWAFSINQSLQDGDEVKAGAYNGSDGWYIEQRGSDHTDTQVDFVEERGGTRNVLETDVELSKPLTDFTRFQLQYSWYNVGSQEVVQTYTENGVQRNDRLFETSNDNVRGPETGNLNLWQEVTADASTSGLELNAGSMAQNTLGKVTGIVRDKPQRVEVTLPSTNDTWEPIYAIRIEPATKKQNVNCSLADLQIVSYGNNTDVELVAVSMSPDKTDATGWSRPEYQHDQSSVFQETTNISEVPNTSGTQTDLGANEKFGGYTLGAAQIESGGNTQSTTSTQSNALEQKKRILASDELVFLTRTSNGGARFRFVWDANQRW